jgi:hypothetical protein
VSHRYQSLSARNPHGFEQHRIHQREDHGVEANAHRQRRHHGGRKPAMGENHTQSEAQIMCHGIGLRNKIPECSLDSCQIADALTDNGMRVHGRIKRELGSRCMDQDLATWELLVALRSDTIKVF